MANRFWAIRRIDRNYVEPMLYKREEAARAAVAARRGYELVALSEDDGTLVWQVRDTCTRAEAAEARALTAETARDKAVEALRRMDRAWSAVATHPEAKLMLVDLRDALAELETPSAQRKARRVYVCSNSKCDAVWDNDPQGPCPACHLANGGGWSTMTRDLRELPEALTELASNGGDREAAVAEALTLLSLAADEVNGEIDRQTYDEKAKADWDLPDDHVFDVQLSAKLIRDMNAAICAAQTHLRAAQALGQGGGHE